jgi:hypothetical protein
MPAYFVLPSLYQPLGNISDNGQKRAYTDDYHEDTETFTCGGGGMYVAVPDGRDGDYRKIQRITERQILEYHKTDGTDNQYRYGQDYQKSQLFETEHQPDLLK